MKHDTKYASPYGPGDSGPRVNIRGAVRFLQHMRPFTTAHCCARWLPTTDIRSEHERIRMQIAGEQYRPTFNYVVYTGTPDTMMGMNPLFVFDPDAKQWFECQEPLYGRITSQTRKRLRPLVGETLTMDLHDMQMLLCFGYRHMARLRLGRGERSENARHEVKMCNFANLYGTTTGRNPALPWGKP